MVTLDADGSRWVLRGGQDPDRPDRFAHLHPGRWSPATRRVRASVLKTALMVLAYQRIHGGDSHDVSLINKVRADFLDLSPIRGLSAGEGLDAILHVLSSS